MLLREAERAVLGGAANVCANLAALGAEVTVIGVIGRDDAGSLLLDLLRAYPKLRADLVVTDIDRPTTCKIRVMSGAHQMVRIDAESRTEIAAEVEDAVALAIRHSVRSADVVVLSDYAKGLCNDRIIRAVIATAAQTMMKSMRVRYSASRPGRLARAVTFQPVHEIDDGVEPTPGFAANAGSRDGAFARILFSNGSRQYGYRQCGRDITSAHEKS